MRINFFSLILVLLIITSVAKVSFVFDRAMKNYANIETKASTMFVVGSANANSPPSAVDATAKVEKIATEAKGEKQNLVDQQNEPLNKQNQQEKVVPGMDNLLQVGYTSDEIKLLKELSKRREELDRYQQQLTLKESLLKSTEEKLDKKMDELKLMEDRINSLMAQLDDKSNIRIKSLAKIYENMKPQEAAKIFDELEMPVLLEIIRNMKEPKVASVIAQMNPQKAKDVSLEFAKVSDGIENIKR